ncbi:hypothetical protein A3C23_05135 [Candidatus Roizmanbacteria bacterium RIFCSPHIGHO2_02_FULL_37_13b]|uniref:Glycosyltransferase 2-like domain-containing protein n=1 Tax=Candidatus Roizmanbacteria bacterium RIFCSPLOWO2_02_FULL_36_11 TaxID=1802071 RepID=A0A1F7JFL9_9BACT|nr:MAG: hypothetical protein A3C23_05135 [Candidatus Roizmanbacteria bacterium RIFCSPHIGHO2_02_FULL_37_13b]OGK54405.1 MAG: hypothetical protein A3H78_03745 [Candidatus Roizmanbacteria bacterium RIFCSPLOWO2_02_FULL_36_11]
MKTTITAVIYTFNEEENIEAAIKSAANLSKKIIVIDMESDDKTVEIAKDLGVDTFNIKRSNYVEPARQFGIELVNTPWVFVLDADERISPELVREIREKIDNNKYTYYAIPRKNIFGGIKWLRHGGWWPDSQIRLIKKEFFKSWPCEIHSTPIISGRLGTLNSPILHYFHPSLENMVKKTIIFEQIESDLLYKGEKKVSVITFFRKFIGELYRRLLKQLGLKDGVIGIIESLYQAFSKSITYIFLYEKKRQSRSV